MWFKKNGIEKEKIINQIIVITKLLKYVNIDVLFLQCQIDGLTLELNISPSQSIQLLSNRTDILEYMYRNRQNNMCVHIDWVIVGFLRAGQDTLNLLVNLSITSSAHVQYSLTIPKWFFLPLVWLPGECVTDINVQPVITWPLGWHEYYNLGETVQGMSDSLWLCLSFCPCEQSRMERAITSLIIYVQLMLQNALISEYHMIIHQFFI